MTELKDNVCICFLGCFFLREGVHCTENLGKIKKCFYVGSMSPCVVFHRTQVIVRKFLTIKKIANIANISLLT